MNLFVRYTYYTALVFFIASCGDAENTKGKKSSVETTISLESDLGVLMDLGAHKAMVDDIRAYYTENDYKPFWFEKNGQFTSNGLWLDSVMGRVEYLGLDRGLFIPITESEEGFDSKKEFKMSLNFAMLCSYIEHGVLDVEQLQRRMLWEGESKACFQWLNSDTKGLNEKLKALQPQYHGFQGVLAGLGDFLDHYPLLDSSFTIPDPKEDSLGAADVAKKMLFVSGFADSSLFTDDTVYIHALKDLQELHGLFRDGRLGKNTRKALQMSNLDRFRTACLALEKYRGQGKVPTRFLHVNIPEFTLRFYDQNHLVRKHRVVVGTPANSTPEFRAELKRLITYPFWNVPYSIASKEIVYKVAKDSTHLAKMGYEVFDRKGNKLDPKTIDWAKHKGNFPYRIRQQSGSGNSLGLIKFQFPNEHAVFIHDTPSKRLFKNESRAYSHGCIRLEHPLDLAKSVITLDSNIIVSDTLDSIMARKQQKVIELNRPFDVIISYITTGTDSTGQIRFFHDLYGRDDKYLNALFTD